MFITELNVQSRKVCAIMSVSALKELHVYVHIATLY